MILIREGVTLLILEGVLKEFVSFLIEIRTITHKIMFIAQVTLTAALLVAPMVTATVSQGHLALSDTGMSVMWVSDSIPTSNTTANVQYGIHPTKLTLRTLPASSDTYKPTDLCGPPANTSTLPVPTLWSANIDFSAASSAASEVGKQVSEYIGETVRE